MSTLFNISGVKWRGNAIALPADVAVCLPDSLVLDFDSDDEEEVDAQWDRVICESLESEYGIGVVAFDGFEPDEEGEDDEVERTTFFITGHCVDGEDASMFVVALSTKAAMKMYSAQIDANGWDVDRARLAIFTLPTPEMSGPLTWGRDVKRNSL